MKKESWALALGGVAILISIIATCIAAYRTPELGFDYQGVIVGILSLLVTVLIGWQISNYLLFEKRMQNEVKDLKYSVQISVCTSLSQLGLALYNNNDYAGAMQAFFNSINAWDKNIKNKLSDEAYQCAINHFKNMANKNASFAVDKEDFATHLNAAKKTEDKDIINFVKRFRLKDS